MCKPFTPLPDAILGASLLLACGLLAGAAPAAAGPPAEPWVVDFDAAGKTIGKPGGELHTLVGRAKDTRLMVVYGYARLVGYDQQLELVPDILKEVEVEDGRRFTLHLRRGHLWSDGAPFTSEDFRYWWEDVANNQALSPTGPSPDLFVDGELATVEFPDELTVRYSWSKPNPFFLPALAMATPLFIYMPAHYLKQFHERYADPDQLAALVQETQARDWAQLHGRHDDMYKFENPDLPTLQPWRVTTAPPAERFVFERNPNFHRVDPSGQQLPYIDRVVLDVVDNKLVPIKTGAGETDLQSRGLFFKHYTFLKESEERSNLRTYLWQTARGAHLALYPNLNAHDKAWRELFRDVRFRRALSLAVDREEINQILYFGLGFGGNNTVLPQSPLYEPEYREQWAEFDLAQANALLDEIGLTERSDAGLRLLPDGRPLELIVETAGEETEQADVLELVRRILPPARPQDPHQALAARGLPQPDLLRRDPDVDLVRARERHPERRHEPGRVRSVQPAAAAVADVGPVPRDQGPGRRAARSAGGGAAARAVRGLAGGARPPRSAAGSGRRSSRSTPSRSTRSV